MGDDRPGRRRPGRSTGSSVLTPPTGVPVVPDDAESLLDAQRHTRAVVWMPPDADAVAGSCVCGHGSPSHEHWRPGSDCGVCGAVSCPVFRGRGGRVRRLLRRLRLVR